MPLMKKGRRLLGKRPEIASVTAAVASDRVIKIGNDGEAVDATSDGKNSS